MPKRSVKRRVAKKPKPKTKTKVKKKVVVKRKRKPQPSWTPPPAGVLGSASEFTREAREKKDKHGVKNYRKYLFQKYEEVFGKEADRDESGPLLWAAIAYELQYRGYVERNAKDRLTTGFLANREAALRFSLKGMSPTLRSNLKTQIDRENDQLLALEERSERARSLPNFGGRAMLGKTLNLTIANTWAHLFTENAKAKKSKRQTDDELMTFVQSEFPDRDSSKFRSAAWNRRRFNKGQIGEGKPSSPSTPYDENGKPLPVDEGLKKRGRPAVKKASAKKGKGKATKKAKKGKATKTKTKTKATKTKAKGKKAKKAKAA